MSQDGCGPGRNSTQDEKQSHCLSESQEESNNGQMLGARNTQKIAHVKVNEIYARTFPAS